MDVARGTFTGLGTGRAVAWFLANGRDGPLTFFLGAIGESAAASRRRSHGSKGKTVQNGGMATEGAAKDAKIKSGSIALERTRKLRRTET